MHHMKGGNHKRTYLALSHIRPLSCVLKPLADGTLAFEVTSGR